MIHLERKRCGQAIKVPEAYAGKTGRCPRYKSPIVVPATQTTDPASGQEHCDGPETRSVDPAYDTDLFDLGPTGKPAAEATSRCHTTREKVRDPSIILVRGQSISIERVDEMAAR